MTFSTTSKFNNREEAHILLIPFWASHKKCKAAGGLLGSVKEKIQAPIEAGDFTGKEGEVSLVYLSKEKEKRALLLGLGKEQDFSIEVLRKAYAAAGRFFQKKKISRVNLVLPNIVELRNVSVEECIQGICEGLLLTNYQWKTGKETKGEFTFLKHVTLIGILPKIAPFLRKMEKMAEGVYFARDLVNGNADLVTPAYLAESAREIAQQFSSVKVSIFDKKRIEKEKMGLLLAVGKASFHEPFFITLSYKGNPRSKEHTVLVGKGVTYDTGGLNLKPTGYIETMRSDMAGAATVLATLFSTASLGLKVNVTAVIPTTENAIGKESYKPGDVFSSYSGKTVEIGNTDAEGRLILADALSYSIDHLSPTRIIDVATLTGAAVVALGEEVAGLFCNDEALAEKIESAAAFSGENVWRLPLHLSYKKSLKSDIADLKNVGGKYGGAITAALFLHEFIGKMPWAHLDIAGPAFASKEFHYLPKNGVGFGVRLLLEFLEGLE